MWSRCIVPSVAGLLAVGSPSGASLIPASTSSQASWIPTFGRHPGVDGAVLSMAFHDDGSGPALFVGGQFAHAGSPTWADNVAKWDGSSWAPLLRGLNTEVRALTVFDDGNGSALYAGGTFTDAFPTLVRRVARWDGTAWSALGSGIASPGYVNALAVFDDGGGPALFVGGLFTIAGGVGAHCIAKWDGARWSALGSGVSDEVLALGVFDDGSGPALYAGGTFTSAGGISANRIAKWDGTSWSALGIGVDHHVRALTVFDDGSGPALYVGGPFENAGGVPARYVARWSGSSWSPLSMAPQPWLFVGVWSFTVFDDGGGPRLLAAAGTKGIQMWNGAGWSDVGHAAHSIGLLAIAEGTGQALYSAGTSSHGITADHIARWDGTSWSPLGKGANDPVHAAAVLDDGSGPALYMGGEFTLLGGVEAQRVAKWDGTNCATLGEGLNGEVLALSAFDDGGGPAIFAGGEFFMAGGEGLAKWDGASWLAVGGGVGGAGTETRVNALQVHDDGSGPALYVAGQFRTAGSLTTNHIARWNGSSWSPVGGGRNRLQALAVFDDGSGPALIAAGHSGAGLSYERIGKWDGASWSPLGSGLNGTVYALTVFDDGSGPALYAGGEFTVAGGVPANRVAKWDGMTWSALPNSGELFTVTALAGFDDGTGPSLYAGGAARGVSRYDGSSWSDGLGGGLRPGATVSALTPFYDGTRLALVAAGDFLAEDTGDIHLARWGSPDTQAPSLACPPLFALGFSTVGDVVTFSVTATDDQDPSPSVVCVPPSGSVFPLGTTMVTCTATDGAGNQSTCQFPLTLERKARRR